MTSYARSAQIQFTGTSSSLKAVYNPPIELDPSKQHTVEISGGYFTVAWPNISTKLGNNTIKIAYNSGTDVAPVWSYTTVTLPDGRYDINDIGDFLTNYQRNLYDVTARHFVVAGDTTLDKSDDIVGVTISFDNTSMKTKVYLQKNFQVNLSNMGKWLGWTDDQILSNSLVDILSDTIPTIEGDYKYYNITCNLVETQPVPTSAGYLQLLYTNNPNVGSGMVQELPQTNTVPRVYLDPQKSKIHEATCQITDQDGNLLDMRGQNVFIAVAINEK